MLYSFCLLCQEKAKSQLVWIILSRYNQICLSATAYTTDIPLYSDSVKDTHYLLLPYKVSLSETLPFYAVPTF